MRKILLVEDDKDLNAGLVYDLETEGYQVYTAFTLKEGEKLFEEKEPDLVLLDLNLPDGEGFVFCRQVKARKDIPVIFLTARDMEQDEMKGFDCGADDYITKPFKMPILNRRIEAALRRSGTKTVRNVFDDGYLNIDFDRLTATRKGDMLTLTPTEYKILRVLTANSDKVMTKRILLEKIWDSSGNFVDEHALAVNINRLRKKIESEGHEYIKTLYGMGYQWKGER